MRRRWAGWGWFVGQPEVEFIRDRQVRLLKQYTFVRGWRAHRHHYEEWAAEAGLLFDGACVPRLLRWFADPFARDHRLAAVIHDAAYKRRDKPRAVCDQVLYEALRASGVSPLKASLFYWAVRVFGPKW